MKRILFLLLSTFGTLVGQNVYAGTGIVGGTSLTSEFFQQFSFTRDFLSHQSNIEYTLLPHSYPAESLLEITRPPEVLLIPDAELDALKLALETNEKVYFTLENEDQSLRYFEIKKGVVAEAVSIKEVASPQL